MPDLAVPNFFAPRFAAIDMGTNTFRLLIAEIKDGPFLKTIYSENRIVRLGKGFAERKIIRPEALERALAALCAFQKVIDKKTVSALIVTGTSAVRNAENRESFLNTIKEKCGFEVEVLSGKEEARLTLLGVSLIFQETESENESTVIIDIGGGSTELIRTQKAQPPFFVSLDLGAVTLSEKYLQSDPPTSNELHRLKNAVADCLIKIAPHFPAHCRFAGTAGTVTTLAAIDQLMTHYDANKINRYQLSKSRIAQILENLCALPKEKRRHLPGLEKGRADIIIAGTVMLLAVMNCFSYDLLHVSDYGLREGVLIQRFGSRAASSHFF